MWTAPNGDHSGDGDGDIVTRKVDRVFKVMMVMSVMVVNILLCLFHSYLVF